ncbi:hypothetical protein [Pedobacter aquatilis]|uniref:hypothetical protein n=1 Tax=Pedobacter aquatilis TaxID=351343 RepID=UPI00292F1D18|nr:hypothetical protein [Pedobacter aquatilis]
MDKELIDHIKDNLVSHEEAYTPGAWERFSAQEEKKQRGFVLWPLWSAAAIILVIGSIFFLQNNNPAEKVQVVKTVKQKNNEVKPATPEITPKTENTQSNTSVARSKTLKTGHSSNPVKQPAAQKEENSTTNLSIPVQKEEVLANNTTIVTPITSAAVPAKVYEETVSESEAKLLGGMHQERIASNLTVKKAEFVPEKKKAASTKEEMLAGNTTTVTPITSTAVPAKVYEEIVSESEAKLLGGMHQERIATNLPVKKAEFVPEKKKTSSTKITFEQLLEQDSYNNKLAKNEKTKHATKWEPGVFVAPSMGNDNKVNMNYGFSLSYNVADKLSISSGITYAALSTTSNPSALNASHNDAVASAPVTSTGFAYSSASRSLESINASVRGINIPLELKYNLSKKFYAGAGVSALAVLNNKQDNNYLVSSAQNTAVANSAGITEQRMLIVTDRVSEPQSQAATASDKYIGFYNFSLGYKQKISKKNDFAIEPFLRLPMKTFSNDNLNLTNGGVRLKFDF